jgi:hypothetical protein
LRLSFISLCGAFISLRFGFQILVLGFQFLASRAGQAGGGEKGAVFGA